jgi:hypothetical protein
MGDGRSHRLDKRLVPSFGRRMEARHISNQLVINYFFTLVSPQRSIIKQLLYPFLQGDVQALHRVTYF